MYEADRSFLGGLHASVFNLSIIDGLTPNRQYQADLDSPCQELSNGDLGFVVAVLIDWGIKFLHACAVGPIQL